MKQLTRWSAQNLGIIFLACLTLGLAPFFPEPHLWQKISWLKAGSPTLVWYDWFDIFLHGAPWVLLLIGLGAKVFKALPQSNEKTG